LLDGGPGEVAGGAGLAGADRPGRVRQGRPVLSCAGDRRGGGLRAGGVVTRPAGRRGNLERDHPGTPAYDDLAQLASAGVDSREITLTDIISHGEQLEPSGRAPSWTATVLAAMSMTRKYLVRNFTSRFRGNALI
jgi:hypothetical protein